VLIKGVLKMSVNYNEVVSAVKSAVKISGDTENKWVKAGGEVFAFFGSEKALDEVKAQFIADAILPAVDKKHAEYLGKDIPRKGSKEYNALGQSELAKWNEINEGKKSARAVCGVMYNRVKSYAFEKEKKESTKKSFVEKISALIEEGGKIKECNFDLVTVMGFLIQAEKVAKGSK
jgi:hypothetical protein